MPDLDTMLAELNDDVPPMTDEAFANGRARLTDAIAGVPKPRPRRLTALVAAAASVVAITGAVVLTRTDGPPPVSTPADVAVWAKGLANDPPRVGPGQYLYQRMHTTLRQDLDDPAFRVEITATGERWIPHDYRDEWRAVFGGDRLEFIRGTESEARAANVDIPAMTPATDLTAECGRFEADPPPCHRDGWGTTGSPAFYAELTGDPARLYEVIENHANDKGSRAVFAGAYQLLQPNIPSDFKATLFEAMSRIPGLVITDGARTADGRTGIGLTVDSLGTRRVLVLDRTTGDLLEARLRDGHATITSTVTYGVTDSLDQRPG